jgi:hypothetical protein
MEGIQNPRTMFLHIGPSPIINFMGSKNFSNFIRMNSIMCNFYMLNRMKSTRLDKAESQIYH